MAPQVKHSSAVQDMLENGLGGCDPIGFAEKEVVNEIDRSQALQTVARDLRERRGYGLDGCRQNSDAVLHMRHFHRHQFDCANRAVSGLAGHTHVFAPKMALRKTKRGTGTAADLFQLNLAIHYFAASNAFGNLQQVGVMYRVGTDFKVSAQLANLQWRQHRQLVIQRNVKRRRQAVFVQQVRNAQVERVAVVPACSDESSWIHAENKTGGDDSLLAELSSAASGKSLPQNLHENIPNESGIIEKISLPKAPRFL